MLPESVSSPTVVVLACLIIYMCTLSVYRLYFSPLARFPGPKLAAVSGWYEFYYDIIQDGQYYLKVEKLHRKYGPIIRINPWELHASDPVLFSHIYSSGVKQRVEKYAWSQKGLRLIDDSHILTESHELHRLRRKPLATFFSPRNTESMEPVVWKVSQRIRSRLQKLNGSGSVMVMEDLFTVVSADLVAAFSFDDEIDLTQTDELQPLGSIYSTLQTVARVSAWLSHFSWITALINAIPPSFLMRLAPTVATNNRLYSLVKKQFESSRAVRASSSKTDDPLSDDEFTDELLSPDTKLIAHLLHSNLPPHERTPNRVCAELLTIFMATIFNIPRAMMVTTYHILANPDIKAKLCGELNALLGPGVDSPQETPVWALLNKAEYLKACVKEGLRLFFGALRGTARRNLHAPIAYRDWVIPPGTPVGMSAWMLNTDPEVYPDPLVFRPERWLPGNHKPEMDRNFASLGKGSRTCLGIHLVYVFMRHLLAAMFGPGEKPELRLFETEESDVATAVSGLSGLAKKGARGLRVVVE
ncbi:cytochrome P450 [Cercophora samala]|uniref:Cytochrome P450 n=1 Tax=Cercophora samala TaxID=330535 RepID=A0AA39YX18_9PEZI|nr:cytochrome P450 [Cercophora samala]